MFIRHPSQIPIHFTQQTTHTPEYSQPANQEHEPGELCFTTCDCIRPGSHIKITIPVRNDPFQVNGIVVHCIENVDCYEVGVKFLDHATRYAVRMVEQICWIEHYRSQTLEQEGRSLSSEQAAMEWIELYGNEFPALE